MAYQVIPDQLKADLNNVVVSALKRPGVANELSIHQSFLGFLAARNRISFRTGGGETVRDLKWKYSSPGTAEYYAKYAAAPAAGNELVKDAQIGFAYVRDVINIHNFDQSASIGAIIGASGNSLWAERIMEAAKEIISQMETKLITGLGAGNDPLGLLYWVNDTSVIGNVNQATDTWAQSKVVDATTGALTLTHLREACEDSKDNNGANIDVIVSSARQINKYLQLMDGAVRYTNLAIGEMQFRAVEFDGIPWIPLANFPQAYVLGLDTSTLGLEILLQGNTGGQAGQIQLAEVEGQGLPFAIRPQDTNGVDAQSAVVTNYHQLFCTAPWKNFRIENLSSAL